MEETEEEDDDDVFKSWGSEARNNEELPLLPLLLLLPLKLDGRN